jgi:hypothetical protein
MKEEYKRYIAFAFPEYYPSGGLADIKTSFDDFQEAMNWLGTIGYEHDTAYIFDRIDCISYTQVER